MNLKTISKELSDLAQLELDAYLRRGELIQAAKEHFETTNSWLAWSKSHLGISKSTHYQHIQLYKAFNDGTFGREMKRVPIMVLTALISNEDLRNEARVDMRNGISVDCNWLKEKRSK
ncbi:hypothetical protein [Vibrio owensii]|uniref:hypothetical protein n=1 Tax=Vibrio owensii TaxID=696485 RepID=UPI003AAAC05C